MSIDSMKAESTDEARERLRAMSAAEREGFEKSAEGQLTIARTEEQDARAAEVDEKHGAVVQAFDAFSVDAAVASTAEGAPAKAAAKAKKAS